MNKIRGKRGDTNYLWIIVGIIIIVTILALYFFVGGKGFAQIGDWISNLVSPINVDTVIAGCNTACSGSLQDAWCNQQRNVNFERIIDGKTGKGSITLTCNKWANDDFTTPIPPATTLPKKAEGAGVLTGRLDSCPAISCS